MADDQNILDRLAAVEAYIEEHKLQQITYPLDNASRAVLQVISSEGKGATSKTQTYTDSRGDTLTGPKAYASTWLIRLIDGTLIEVPSLV